MTDQTPREAIVETMTLREKIKQSIITTVEDFGPSPLTELPGWEATLNQRADDILAAVREEMLSEGAVAHYIDAVERAGVEDDPEPTYEESARLSAAFWLQAAGITESEVENDTD